MLYEDIESSSVSSETAGFLGGLDIKAVKSWSPLILLRNLRIIFELLLISLLLLLLISGSIHLPSKTTESPHYGLVLP